MKRLAVVAVLLALTSATACGGGGGGSTADRNGLYTTIDALKPGLDANAPINPYNPKGNAFLGYNAQWLGWTKNNLTDSNQFYPGVAESWKIAPHQSSITIKLRPNGKWSDGRPITAEDVKFSIGLAYTQGGTAYALDPSAAGTASDIKIVDDHTIKITQSAKNPSNSFVQGVMETFIVPEHVWAGALPADFWAKLKLAQSAAPGADAARAEITSLADKVIAFAPPKDVSAGPFTLARMNPGEALLVKNPYFYNAAKVAPDKVKILNYTGNEQIWNYLISGQLDNAPFTALPADVMERIVQTSGNGVVQGYSPVGNALAFNQSKKPYDNVHVRRALAYLIDRKQVTKVASPEGGVAALTTSGMHQKAAEAWLGDKFAALNPYKVDPAQAAKELEAAGMRKIDGKWTMPDGTPWKLTINVPASFSDWVAGAKAVTSQLNDAGIDAQVVTTADYPLYLQEIAAGKYDIGFWLVALGPSPYNIFQRLYGASNGWQLFGGRLKHVAPGKEGNWMGGPETIEVKGVGKVDPGELAVKLNSAPEPEQKKIIGILAEAANQDLPVIQMWDYVNTQFVNTTRFTGFPPNNSDALRLTSGVWLQLGLIKRKQA
ncbi:ABC transporter substrate-binding protein [Streptosporangium sp. 'caverna']|uniref:ABC transporter substrate-binding protein n=1 Tax=Streptosporangium sp. 'caverna' TaxID=2202249 RepID=UPI000D7DE817|nr:ABC transporter substrate-binding protein [Streptosporangium sp. 'caverna']AWS43139.1 peptide ABC transporter substrate-binding protein [Streptosporangium sp. 'caverna']